MNFLAGVLLLFMPEEPAFWCLKVAVEALLPRYFEVSMAGAVVDTAVARRVLAAHFPTVTARAERLQVDLPMVASQWCAAALGG